MSPTPIGDAPDRGQLHPRSPTTGGSSDVSTKTTKRPDEKKPRTDERPPTALVQQFDDLAKGLEEIIGEEEDISPMRAERASSSTATARAAAPMSQGPGQIVTNFQVGTGLIHQVASNADQIANENHVLREALQRAQAMVLNSQREGTLRAEMMAAEVAQAQQVAIGQQEAFRQREHEQQLHVQRMVEAEMGALSHRAEAERQAALGQLSSSAQAETNSLVAKLQEEYRKQCEQQAVRVAEQHRAELHQQVAEQQRKEEIYQIQINNVRKEQEQQMAQLQEQMSKALNSQLETTKMEYIVAFQREKETHHGVVHELMEQMNQLKLMMNNRSGDPGGGVSSVSAPSLVIHSASPNATSSLPSTVEGLQPATAFQGYHPSEPLPPAAPCSNFGAPAGSTGPAGSGGGAGGGAGAGVREGGPFDGTDVLFPNKPLWATLLRTIQRGQVEVEALAELHRRPHLIRPLLLPQRMTPQEGGPAKGQGKRPIPNEGRTRGGPGVEIAGESRKLMPLPS